MAAVDASDRKLYVMAAEKGNPAALEKFDAELKAQSTASKSQGNAWASGGQSSGGASDKLRVTSPATTALQSKLNALGHDAGAEDGIAGPKTSEAIKAFQKANGLVADGIAGPRTMAALNAASSKPAAQASTPPKADGSDRKLYLMGVNKGAEGADVALRKFDRAVSGQAPAESRSGEDYVDGLREAKSAGEAYQLHLEMLGYNPGKIDGVLGKMTGEAVRKFQKDQGLDPDGIIGPDTQAALNKAAQGELDRINRDIDTRARNAEARAQQDAAAPPAPEPPAPKAEPEEAVSALPQTGEAHPPEDPKDIFQFDQTNPLAWLAEKPSEAVLELYEEGFTRLPGYDPENGRSPYRTGFGPAVTVLDKVSPNAIDDYNGTVANVGALGGTLDLVASIGPSGAKASVDGSLQAERIFEGAGLDFLQDRDTPLQQQDAWVEFDGSTKLITSFGQATHFEHNAEGLNRQSSSVTAAQINGGTGGVFDIRIPGTEHRIRLGGAQVREAAVGRLNSTSAAGIVAEDGLYGAALGGGGYAKGATYNESTYLALDTGLGIRFKGSGTVHASAASEGYDALGLALWDDNTGTLSLEAAGGAAAFFGVKADLAGEIQVEQLAGSVEGAKGFGERFVNELQWRINPMNHIDVSLFG